MNKLARLVYARDVVAGRDYALADVVHCRSRDEQGVREALAECVPRYLAPVLALSPAAVVVVLGTEARDAIRAAYGYHDPTVVSRPLAIEGKVRRVVLLAHPSTRGKTRYPRTLDGDDLVTVRAVLAEAAAARP